MESILSSACLGISADTDGSHRRGVTKPLVGPSCKGPGRRLPANFPYPQLLLKLDRMIEVAARNQFRDSGLLHPTLTCSRGCEGPYNQVRCLGPGSRPEALSSCHPGLQQEEGYEATGRSARVSDS